MSYPTFKIKSNPFKSNIDKFNSNNLNFYQEPLITNTNNEINRYNILQGEIESTPLFELFFSSENIERIQKEIKKIVYMKTRGKFLLTVDQNESDLIIVMKAIYFEHAEFLPSKLTQQVLNLNAHLFDFIIPDIITAIRQEFDYLAEINKPVNPIQLPENKNTGKQILPPLMTFS